MIAAEVELTQAFRQLQFVARTGSGHHLILDDTAGGTGAQPIEMLAVGLAGCTAFDVITVFFGKNTTKRSPVIRCASSPTRRNVHPRSSPKSRSIMSSQVLESTKRHCWKPSGCQKTRTAPWVRCCKRQPPSIRPTKSSKTQRRGFMRLRRQESSVELPSPFSRLLCRGDGASRRGFCAKLLGSANATGCGKDRPRKESTP